MHAGARRCTVCDMKISTSDSVGRIKPRLAVTVDEVPRLWVLEVAAREHSTASAVVNRLLWAAHDADKATQRKGKGGK